MRKVYLSAIFTASIALVGCTSTSYRSPNHLTLESSIRSVQKDKFEDSPLGENIKATSDFLNGDLKKVEGRVSNALDKASSGYLPSNTKLGKIESDDNLNYLFRKSNQPNLPKQGLSWGYKF